MLSWGLYKRSRKKKKSSSLTLTPSHPIHPYGLSFLPLTVSLISPLLPSSLPLPIPSCKPSQFLTGSTTVSLYALCPNSGLSAICSPPSSSIWHTLPRLRSDYSSSPQWLLVALRLKPELLTVVLMLCRIWLLLSSPAHFTSLFYLTTSLSFLLHL